MLEKLIEAAEHRVSIENDYPGVLIDLQIMVTGVFIKGRRADKHHNLIVDWPIIKSAINNPLIYSIDEIVKRI